MATFRELDRSDRPAHVVDVIEKFRETAGRHRVRCPSCGWQPGADSRWTCAPTDAPEYYPRGCGAEWHTFETRGRCPGCDHLWHWTMCLACEVWSPHDDWYAPEDAEN